MGRPYTLPTLTYSTGDGDRFRRSDHLTDAHRRHVGGALQPLDDRRPFWRFWL